jgi:hypothetical protein
MFKNCHSNILLKFVLQRKKIIKEGDGLNSKGKTPLKSLIGYNHNFAGRVWIIPAICLLKFV